MLANRKREDNFSCVFSFKLGKSIYAIPALRVREVTRPTAMTPIPRSSEYIGGLVNFRGKIVVTIKMRNLLGMECAKLKKGVNIIVDSANSLFGLEVDEILDVINVEEKVLNETPSNIDEKIRFFIKGIYRLDEGLAILLDLDKVLNKGR